MEGKRAPSLHLWYNDHATGDILTQDVCVPTSGLTKFTYYCGLCWNGGEQGGGYCGIQDHPDGRNFIFSIWDPMGTDQPIQVVHEGCGTKCERFGGEGTGLKSWNFELGWKVDCWYTLTTRRWDENGHTFFGFWIHDQDGDKWCHLVTMEFPVDHVYFSNNTACFLEDWMGSGENVRSLRYKDGFKRGVDGNWIPFDKATFNIVREESSKNYESNFDAGITTECYYLQAGAMTCPSEHLGAGKILHHQSMPTEPSKKPIYFQVEHDWSRQEVTWHVPESSVPHFRYKVLIDDVVIASGIDSEMRICKLQNPPKVSVEVELEDIFGRVTSNRIEVGHATCLASH
jgi:hypothetical protein